jgi:membrane protease YdiL (CAAX protease family)
MASVRIELKILLLAVLSIFCVEIFILTAATRLPANGLLATGIARLVEISAMVIILIQVNGNLAAVGLTKASAIKGFLHGLYWSAGFGLLAMGAGFVLFISGVNPLHLIGPASPSPLSRIFLLFLIGGVIGPVAEEFFFRGILYGYFRRWGVLPAILLSTSFFVLMHPISPLALTQTIGGIVFALAYEREKNLLVPITIHVLGNWAIFGLTLSV